VVVFNTNLDTVLNENSFKKNCSKLFCSLVKWEKKLESFINHKILSGITVLKVYQGECNNARKCQNTASHQHGLGECAVYTRMVDLATD